MVAQGGEQHGPYSQDEIAGYLASGSFTPDALAWKQGMNDWVPVRSIFPVNRSVGAPPPQQAHNSNRIAVGVVAILLGWLGIHKFMLGLTTPGLILLLGTVLTCGVGSAVTSIIGIIEGVIYLTKTDAQFHQEYEVGKKPWF
jgi:TM2 domain-containing membrane protein YozV